MAAPVNQTPRKRPVAELIRNSPPVASQALNRALSGRKAARNAKDKAATAHGKVLADVLKKRQELSALEQTLVEKATTLAEKTSLYEAADDWTENLRAQMNRDLDFASNAANAPPAFALPAPAAAPALAPPVAPPVAPSA